MLKRLFFSFTMFGILLAAVSCNENTTSDKTDKTEVADKDQKVNKDAKEKRELKNDSNQEGRNVANIVEARIKTLKKKFELNDAKTNQARVILQTACKTMKVELDTVLATKEEQQAFVERLTNATKDDIKKLVTK